MPSLILSLRLADLDLAAIRTHTRHAAEIVGLESLQQTRLATAVSEIARNAAEFARDGTVQFLLAASPASRDAQCLVVEVRDRGPGIPDVDEALRGRRLPTGRTTMGIPGSRRLVDRLSIELPADGGTLVRLEMDLPPGRPGRATPDLGRMAEQILRAPRSPLQELEQQNRELLRVHQELRDQQAELEKADERKNQFVKTLVHELRSPLSTLEMTLALLRRKPDMSPRDLLTRCEVMGRQTAQLTKLVDELMDAARVSQGKVELDRKPSELNALVAEAVEMTGAAIAAKDHQVVLRPCGEPLWVSADVSRLTQVMCNLIQNSARYTPRNGRIGIEVERQEGNGVVKVTDNGIGIAGDLLPHVFDLFVQGDTQAPGSPGGLGIGLTLVRHLVAIHGGEVSVASPGRDQGTTFVVSLPLIEQAAPA